MEKSDKFDLNKEIKRDIEQAIFEERGQNTDAINDEYPGISYNIPPM